MNVDKVKELEDKLEVLDFKIELLLRHTKTDINLTLESCKTMDDFAYVVGLKRDEFDKINDLLTSQIKFYKSFKGTSNNSYISPRQYTKIDDDINVFMAFSKEEFEENIGKCSPKLSGNSQLCEKIAKINGIHELYYDKLAIDIRKEKNERLDKETKLLNNYKDNKEVIDNLFNELTSFKKELINNLNHVNSIIGFFNENELIRISIFYNGELWDKSEDDKRVVINENSYIHNVCKLENNPILDKFTEIIKDKKLEYHDLFVYLLKSGPTSSSKIEALQTFYKSLKKYNENEYIEKTDMIDLFNHFNANIAIVDEILNTYHDYIKTVK